MKEFIKDLLASGDGTSSKRFSALITLFNVIILAWISTLNSATGVVPEYIFNGLLFVIAGGLGLTVIEKIFAKK